MRNVEKIVDEIAKTKVKINELTNRLRELEKQKIEAENFNIVELVRSMELNPDELRAFIQAHKQENANAAEADIKTAPARKEEKNE